MRYVNTVLLLCLGLCLSAVAAEDLKHPEAYEKAISDIVDTKQQYTKTIIKNAAKGDKSFQFILGKAYLQGKNMPVDVREGRVWLKLAADNGHEEAKLMYALNMLNAEKYREAHELLNQVLDSFPGEANYHLGQMYFKGQGVAPNKAKSVELTRKAAESGHTDANFFMYKCLFYGVGVSKNTVKAMTHLEKAAEADHLEAVLNMARGNLAIDGDKANKYIKKAEVLLDDKQKYEDWREEILSQYAPRAFKSSGSVNQSCRTDTELLSIISVISEFNVRTPTYKDCKKHIETCKSLEQRDYPASVLLALEGGRYLFSEDARMQLKGLKKVNGKWVSYQNYSAQRLAAEQRAEEEAQARAEEESNRPVYEMRPFPCERCMGTGYTEGFRGSAPKRCLVCKGKGTVLKRALVVNK